LTAEQLQAARREHWRQTQNPILTAEDAKQWLRLHPLSLFLPRQAQLPAPAPSFVEAVAGESNATPPFAAVETATEILSGLTASGSVIPLNLLGGAGEQPDFLAQPDVLPFIASLRGDRDWKSSPAGPSGRGVSPLILELWTLLEKDGAMTAGQAREKLGRELTESAVLRALDELWKRMRIVSVPQRAGQPALWEPLKLRHSQALATGSGTSQVTAISLLISTYLQSVYAASGEEVEIFLSPLVSRSRIREALRGLSATRQVQSLSMDAQTYYFLEGGLPEFAPVAETESREKEEAVARRASIRLGRRPEAAGAPPSVSRERRAPAAGARTRPREGSFRPAAKPAARSAERSAYPSAGNPARKEGGRWADQSARPSGAARWQSGGNAGQWRGPKKPGTGWTKDRPAASGKNFPERPAVPRDGERRGQSSGKGASWQRGKSQGRSGTKEASRETRGGGRGPQRPGRDRAAAGPNRGGSAWRGAPRPGSGSRPAGSRWSKPSEGAGRREARPDRQPGFKPYDRKPREGRPGEQAPGARPWKRREEFAPGGRGAGSSRPKRFGAPDRDRNKPFDRDRKRVDSRTRPGSEIGSKPGSKPGFAPRSRPRPSGSTFAGNREKRFDSGSNNPKAGRERPSSQRKPGEPASGRANFGRRPSSGAGERRPTGFRGKKSQASFPGKKWPKKPKA
jgi:hypothetical protein